MSRWVWICMLIAAVVRVGAATGLPMDSDEPIYLQSANHYASAVGDGEYGHLLDQPYNPEHPALIKLAHGLALVPLGTDSGLVHQLAVVRGLQVGGGVLLAGVLAHIHPAAGLAAAVHTLHAKYTAQGYLEAWPMLAMLVALIAWGRICAQPTSRWVLILGVSIGVAGAGKLIHALPAVVLLVDLAWRQWRLLGPVLLACALTMLLLDPGLWLDPVGRLEYRFLHHAGYAPDIPQPWWLPLVAIGGVLPTQWHPDVFPLSLDPMLLVLGVSGLVRSAWRGAEHKGLARVALAWLILCMGFVMAWPTRWAQHALVVLVPVCIGVGMLVADRFRLSSIRFGPSGSRRPAGE